MPYYYVVLELQDEVYASDEDDAVRVAVEAISVEKVQVVNVMRV